MSTNMISSATAPYLLYGERSGKPRETYGNRFSDALEKEKAQNNIVVSAAEIAVNEMDNTRKETAVSEPSYTVTEEEAEYFREKYGEKYNDSEPFKLFDELAKNNIISQDDACAASRKSGICRVEGLPPPDIIDKLCAANGGHYTFRNLKFYFGKPDYTNNGSSTYDEFRESKNTPIKTWQDYVQDNYDYYQYLMDNYTTLRDFSGKPYMTDIDEFFGSRCEAAERVQNVLTQIFGE
ncbi:MAG: hypothetical protein K2K44_03855 [Oscillospiraceae bacterium]|nr:hypothetical protein [Oscillospiraceae bacterium]